MLLLWGCTASGTGLGGETFGGIGGPQEGEGASDTEPSLPKVSAGSESAGDDSDTDADADPTGDPSTGPEDDSGGALECAPGETTSCYAGPAGTEGVGPCQPGTRTCGDDGAWGSCVGATVPVAESCNGLDDDCDGATDEDDPEGGAACTTALPGACAGGTVQCIAGELTCQSDVPPAASDTCGNGIDDDCNGTVDDGCTTASACDPANPAPVCGAGQHCTPSTTGATTCQGPVGLGTQYDACASDADCAADHVCVNTGQGTVYCMQWCTSTAQCPLFFDACTSLTPSVGAGTQEYGVCYDGLP